MPKRSPKKDYEEETTEEDEKIGNSGLTLKEEKRILNQVENEFQLCWEYTQDKRKEQLRRLKLYNNQKRQPAKVGDPLLFSVFNTVLASLYDDVLTSRFEGREEGDEETAENLTATAKFDHNLMRKNELDYEWIWDAGFFSRGLMGLFEFDREKMCPIAEVWDPMTFLRDPRGTSVNGNMKGYGALRFFGREIGLSKSELKDQTGYIQANVKRLRKDKDVRHSLTAKAKEARRDAQGLDEVSDKEEALDENYEYQLLEWFTHIDGKKYIVTVGNGRKLLVRYQELKTDRWALIDRPLFPMSHNWDGVNIPDLIEDKQRARAVMINLGMESAKADLYPMYLFNKRKITNERDLDFEFNKFIPVKGDVNNVVTPVQKSVFHQQVNLILNILDVAAQKAVAAPEVAQGVQTTKPRTLGETQEILAGKEVRHSLAARIFGWSEVRFWEQWYWLYKENFTEEIDEKIVRIQGPLAPVWRTLTKENLISRVDPDVFIESAYRAEARKQKEFSELSTLAQIALQYPEANHSFVMRRLAQIQGRSKMEIMMMFPPTVDELRAEDENKKINNNKLPKVSFHDDDNIHMEIHNKAADTGAKLAHIEAHKVMMFAKKAHPELIVQQPVKEAPVQNYQPISQAGGEERGRERVEAGSKQPQEELTVE